jgi:AcrR family transcriptional regulator
MSEQVRDGRVLRGDQTRQAVMSRAVRLASTEGLEALSLGRLAGDLGISKSGIFALFGSKEELQLATVRAAIVIYKQTVVEPAAVHPPGLARLWSLCENWLRYSHDRVFPGGCFFYSVSAEFDARPGAVRDVIADSGVSWIRMIEENVDAARRNGELRSDTDPGQLAFELIALLEAANANSVLHNDPRSYVRSATAILSRLQADGADAALLPARHSFRVDA